MKAEMDRSDIISQIGEFSYYQRVIALSILFSNVAVSISMMIMAFGGTIPDWNCLPSEIQENITNITNINKCDFNATHCNRVFLTEWSTIITEWDLVCEKRWVGFTITSIQMAGVLIGSFISGYSSDAIGRKKTLYASELLLFLSNVVTVFSTSWQVFAGLRLVMGLAMGGVLSVNFPLAMEFVGPRWRGILGAIPCFSVGLTILPLFLWLCPDWRYVHVFSAVVSAFPLLSWWYVPESIRWLTVKGKIKEAESIIRHIANKNKVAPPDMTLLKEIYENEVEKRKRQIYTYLDLIRTKEMAKRTFVLSFAWMSQSLAFYCVALGVQNLAGNLFLNMFLLTVVEMPSHLIVLCSANTLGRRLTVSGFYLAAGILALGAALAILYADTAYRGSIVNACAMLANLCVGTSWSVIMVFTTEQYPTVIRNLGYGVANTMARVGATFSSQIVALAAVGAHIPFLVITVLMVVSSGLVLILKETKGKRLLDSIVVVDGQDGQVEKLSKSELNGYGENDESILKPLNE